MNVVFLILFSFGVYAGNQAEIKLDKKDKKIRIYEQQKIKELDTR